MRPQARDHFFVVRLDRISASLAFKFTSFSATMFVCLPAVSHPGVFDPLADSFRTHIRVGGGAAIGWEIRESSQPPFCKKKGGCGSFPFFRGAGGSPLNIWPAE